jgi:hypothetical protein
MIGAAANASDSRPLRPRLCLALVLVLVVAGSVCRVARYLSRRSFWQDEAYVILNLRAKSPAELFGPLDARPGDPQAAPPAFLQIEKASLDRWGASEPGLRWLALVVGLLSLPLMALVVWRLLGPRPGAVLAVGFFALSEQLITHSAEVKQYSGDAFVTCLLLWLATREGHRPRSTLGRLAIVMLAAAVAVWFSYTTVIVAAGIAVAYLVASRPRGARAWGGFALACLPLAASAGALYVVCVRHQQNPALFTDWQEFMADWGKPWTVPWWAVVQTYYLANYTAEGVGPIVLLLAGVGTAVICRSGAVGRPIVVLLAAPIGLCFLAALVDRYPYGGVRTSAFLVPAICLLAGEGFGAPVAARHRLVRRAAWVTAGVAGMVLGWQAVRYVCFPPTRSHLRPVIEYLAEHRRAGDRVWVLGGSASDIYRCYVDPIDPATVLDVDRYNALPPIPPGRLWLVFAGTPDRLKNKIEPRLAEVRAAATQRDSYAVRGGVVYLFERTE